MSNKRVYAKIDLDAVKYNLESMKNNIDSNTKLIAVIKTNGYGHGSKEIAKKIEDVDYLWGFAVATVEEACELIEDGRKKPILILGRSFSEDNEKIVENNIRPAVCDYESAKAFSDIAVSNNTFCKIHIKIDTGMSRIGFQVNEESADLIEQISMLPNIIIEGIFTHFARADEISKEPAFEQIKLFNKMIKMLDERGLTIPIHHCSNSAGIVEIKEANMDAVRAGIILYGLWPSEEVSKDIIDLKPVMSLYSSIAYIKTLEKGRSISYGGIYTTDKETVIATIPVGYGDGYSRGLSNKGYVLIHGKKAPICGRVCMDQFMVDITDIPEAKVGDEVTLLGKDKDEIITMEMLGEMSGRFNYEFACLITDRVPRIYI